MNPSLRSLVVMNDTEQPMRLTLVVAGPNAKREHLNPTRTLNGVQIQVLELRGLAGVPPGAQVVAHIFLRHTVSNQSGNRR
jgi:hypothetical protein